MKARKLCPACWVGVCDRGVGAIGEGARGAAIRQSKRDGGVGNRHARSIGNRDCEAFGGSRVHFGVGPGAFDNAKLQIGIVDRARLCAGYGNLTIGWSGGREGRLRSQR